MPEENDELYEAWMHWQNSSVDHLYMIAAALFDIAESFRKSLEQDGTTP